MNKVSILPLFGLLLFVFAIGTDSFTVSVRKRDVATIIQQKFADFRDNCFPRGSGHGCKCSTTDSVGKESVNSFDSDEECKKPVELQTMENKAKMNEEFRAKYGGLKDNCFPRPGKGCRCVEQDANGEDVEKKYESETDCKVPTGSRARRDVRRSSHNGDDAPSQNVRDPVREKAQANYALVIEELKNKFKGLKEGCYPRPKGCLCVIGKDIDGRDITERRMKDTDCKCKPNERSRECAAAGA